MDNMKAGFYSFIADYENTHQLGSYADASKICAYKNSTFTFSNHQYFYVQPTKPEYLYSLS